MINAEPIIGAARFSPEMLHLKALACRTLKTFGHEGLGVLTSVETRVCLDLACHTGSNLALERRRIADFESVLADLALRERARLAHVA